MIRLKQLMWEHPGWIICSPEYNGNYTALLKNTIDWASNPVKGEIRIGPVAPSPLRAKSSVCSAPPPAD